MAPRGRAASETTRMLGRCRFRGENSGPFSTTPAGLITDQKRFALPVPIRASSAGATARPCPLHTTIQFAMGGFNEPYRQQIARLTTVDSERSDVHDGAG